MQNRKAQDDFLPVFRGAPQNIASVVKRTHNRRRHAAALVSLLCLLGIAVVWARSRRAIRPVGPVCIFEGLSYERVRLPDGPESGGMAHIIRVDLSTPGIELYVTPLEQDAGAHGHHYRLDYASRVAAREELAVVINGAYFSSDAALLPLRGDWARGSATAISNYEVSHLDPHSYLLWFEDDLSPHLETTKPPPQEALRRARWGISGKSVRLRDGVQRYSSPGPSDRRTAVAIDPARRLLWLAVYERASGSVAMAILAERGAKLGMLLDGGDSTTMFIGTGANGISSGTLLSGHRPVATFLGVRACPVTNP